MKARKRSAWVAWLALGFAFYGLAPVVDSWFKRGWERTEPQDVTGVVVPVEQQTRDVLGRPGRQVRTEEVSIGYRYVVGDSRHWGHWTGGGHLVRPLVVIYDPARPERSTLLAQPPSAGRTALGWISLGVAAYVGTMRLVRR